MRILDIIVEGESAKFYAIGDSHAEGIANYGGKNWESLAIRGTPSTDPRHKAAIAQIPKGSTVAVCLGCNDSANAALRNQNKDSSAKTPQQVAANVKSVVDAVNAAGLKAVPVLYPPSTKPGPYGSPYSQQCRDAIKAALPGAIDMEGSTLYDGVHAGANDYVRVARRIEKSSPVLKPDSAQKIIPPVSGMKPGEDRMTHAGAMRVLSVPNGNVNPEVADIQKTLLELGYKLPKHGVDGVRGAETVQAIKQFQRDNKLEVDGDPGPETVSALNKLIEKNKIKIAKSTNADVKAKPNNGEKADLNLAYNSVTQGKIGKLLDIVAKPESEGHYDVMMGGKPGQYKITSMTINELLAFQKKYKAMGNETAAAGRYQFMPKTLFNVANQLGLDRDKVVFDPATQDKCATVLLKEKGLDRWLNGKMSDKQFMDGLSQVWAGLPSPSKGGASWYDKVGSNKAGMSIAAVQQGFDEIKST